ncbi:polysaccharide biosynthesis/export family protein [Synechococcus sp. MIT S9508]|uniref:polysaccharide biosynthesis/export family protein n=1 Tax=Synechococcus sp. MIT S9508 TaxID=1801629 RepID=UPI0007BC557C|nr:polysaccharide biosynthesis/export family protein [Synechococcus sp. MIT S9508]KZR90602.1 Polysialic acid transport protein KpsD precursor [Synechococcus sp. MIT S9508]
MKLTASTSLRHCLPIFASAALAFGVHAPTANTQEQASPAVAVKKASSEQELHTRSPNGTYILGAGDSISIELLDIPEYSGRFTIGPDGTIYLPRLRSLYVEGLTIEELRYFLTQQFSAYVLEPQVFIGPIKYRPIRVYVGGEVARPGYYFLTDQQEIVNQLDPPEGIEGITNNPYDPLGPNIATITGADVKKALRIPTVFDAMRVAGGVTPYSKLKDVIVTRKRPLSSGGGKIRTSLNFLSFITEGNESQNIRLFDGDSVVVARSPVVLREQIIKAGETNLSPDFIQVFVTGRVNEPGSKVLPQGASLDQALASAGGQKILRGRVEFVRFNRDGTTDKRKFSVGGNNPAGSYKNPILMGGDVVRVNESPLSATFAVLDELTGPFLGIYSVYSLFNGF